MKRTLVKTLMFGICLGTGYVAIARKKAPPLPVIDSAKPKPIISAKPTISIKPYKDVITNKAITDSGLFIIHKVEDKYYFEIPKNILGRELLTVARISKAPAGPRFIYAGDMINENVIKFETGPSNKIFLKTISYLETGKDSTEGMYKNMLNSNIQPIAVAFPIVAISADSSATVIDITDMINGDNDIFFFDIGYKKMYGLNGAQSDKSFINSAKSYTGNIEIKTTKTYSKSSPGNSPANSGSSDLVTMELNTSIVLLPEKPMQPRYFDNRVGYFTTQTITDFDANPQGVENYRLIARYRMEPKPEDVEKYKRGELVEPKKQIVYYIDPTTPKKWIPYLIAGVNDWQKAFEKAGFKNAIVGKVAPTYEEDSTFSIDDAAHSAIVYKPSGTPNASGPHIHDPRSGEIIESHVNWYHNVMSLIHDMYFVQASAVDSRARKMEFDDDLMGRLIQFVSSHEVGHTLGLRHNFGASSTTPVEKLRDKTWVEANGHTPSIMDYARFNYVAQPEDNISNKGMFPRIGDYDTWAIEWGYRWFPEAKNANDEKSIINKWTIEKLNSNARFWWGDGEENRNDPRSQTEDLGDDAMKAGSYGIKNLKRIIAQIPAWTKEPNKDYTNLDKMHGNIIKQFSRYIGHVCRNIGGIEYTPKRVEQPGNVYNFRKKEIQKNAISWLQTNVFTTPTWVLQKNITVLTGDEHADIIESLQSGALNAILSPTVLNKLIRIENEEPANAYPITELLSDLRKGIFAELNNKTAIDGYRRTLQKSYIAHLCSLIITDNPSQGINPGGITIRFSPAGLNDNGDGKSIIKMELKSIRAQILAAAPLIPNSIGKAHLQDMADRIQHALKPNS